MKIIEVVGLVLQLTAGILLGLPQVIGENKLLAWKNKIRKFIFSLYDKPRRSIFIIFLISIVLGWVFYGYVIYTIVVREKWIYPWFAHVILFLVLAGISSCVYYLFLKILRKVIAKRKTQRRSNSESISAYIIPNIIIGIVFIAIVAVLHGRSNSPMTALIVLPSFFCSTYAIIFMLLMIPLPIINFIAPPHKARFWATVLSLYVAGTIMDIIVVAMKT